MIAGLWPPRSGHDAECSEFAIKRDGRSAQARRLEQSRWALADWNPDDSPKRFVLMIPVGPSTTNQLGGIAFVVLTHAWDEAFYVLLGRYSRSYTLSPPKLACLALMNLARLDELGSERRIIFLALVFHGRWER